MDFIQQTWEHKWLVIFLVVCFVIFFMRMTRWMMRITFAIFFFASIIILFVWIKS